METVELAEPGPGEVLIRTAACAICHSDIFYVDGAWGGELPAVYGHEAAGVVEAVGAGRHPPESRRPCRGDAHPQLRLLPRLHRGRARLLRGSVPARPQSPLHDSAGKPIVHGLRTGAFAEHMVVDQSQAVAIPKDMPLDSAALIACGVLTGMGAVVNTAGVKTGSSVVVIGCGGVGLNSIQGARLAGCSPIIAVDVEPAEARGGARIRRDARRSTPKAKMSPSGSAALNGGRKAD